MDHLLCSEWQGISLYRLNWQRFPTCRLYLKFGLCRISFYSGFGLDRHHCIRHNFDRTRNIYTFVHVFRFRLVHINENLLILKCWLLYFNLLSFQPLLSFFKLNYCIKNVYRWIIVQKCILVVIHINLGGILIIPDGDIRLVVRVRALTWFIIYIYVLLGINVREYRTDNQINSNWQHRLHKKKENKSKTQYVLDIYISMHKQTQISYSS